MSDTWRTTGALREGRGGRHRMPASPLATWSREQSGWCAFQCA